MKKGEYLKIDETLFFVVQHVRGKGLLITGQVLQEKVLYFYKNIEGELVSLQPVMVDWGLVEKKCFGNDS